jgi:hypothetical protein
MHGPRSSLREHYRHEYGLASRPRSSVTARCKGTVRKSREIGLLGYVCAGIRVGRSRGIPHGVLGAVS